MSIEWRKIEGFDNYSVSNTGRVRNDKLNREKELSDTLNGYSKVDLYDGHSVRKTMRVHRLVADAFIEKTDGKEDINHIDGNKKNNNVSNLEWVDKKENMRHAFDTGLAKPSYSMLGKKNPNSGRKGIPIRIVETGEVFNSSLECEKAINGNNRHINDCLKGRQETHRGFHFEYV